MASSFSSAANSQGFYVDDSGNVQRKNTRGEYGFASFYEKRSELKAGIDAGYDWRKMDRPDVLKGDRGPLRRPLEGRFRRVDKEALAPAEPRDYGPPDDNHDISGIGMVRPTAKTFPAQGVGTVPGMKTAAAPRVATVMGHPDPFGETVTQRPTPAGERTMEEWLAPGAGRRIVGAAAKEGVKWAGGKIAGAIQKRRGGGAEPPGTQFPVEPFSGRTPPPRPF